VKVTATFIGSAGPQPYALVVSGATNYIADGPTQSLAYTVPGDNFTAAGGALKYILILGFIALLLAVLVVFIRQISKKKTSMMVDPNSFEATDGYYQDELHDNRMGGSKSIFAKIRDIRNGKSKRRQPVADDGFEADFE
jgi:hypothetical protein